MTKKITTNINKLERDYKKVFASILIIVLAFLWGMSLYNYTVNNSDVNRLIWQPLYQLQFVPAMFVFGIMFIIMVIVAKWGFAKK